MLIADISAFTLTCALAALLRRATGRLTLLDHPNERSLHALPTPRNGGLAIWAGLLVGTVIVVAGYGGRAELGWIVAAVLVVGAVSLADDFSHVPAGLRLLVHALAAGLLLAAGLFPVEFLIPGISIEITTSIGIFLALILIVWMTNLYNFMDGMDGLAGGMTLFGFATLGLLGWLAGDPGYAALCWVIAAAGAGFLVWNFPPAQLFMGDSGASVLGLLAAAMTLWGDRMGLFPLWIGLLVFAPFIVDATVTLTRRLLRGEPVWKAHRGHYYQRLVRAGKGHRGTIWLEYALMLTCAGAALIVGRAPVIGQWGILCAVTAVFVAAVWYVRRCERGHASPELH